MMMQQSAIQSVGLCSRGMKATLPIALLLAAGMMLPVSLVGCSKSNDENGSTSKNGSAAATDRAVARKQSFLISTAALGELESRNAIEIRNQVESRTSIVEVVAEGARVQKGDLLVRLNSDALESQIQEDTLRVESARADFVSAENGVQIQESDNASKLRTAQLDVELAELSLSQWRDGDVKSRRQELALALERGEIEVKRLTDRFTRGEALNKEGFLSNDELERDRVAKIEAEANLKRAVLDAKVYEEFERPKEEKQKLSDVEQAKAELDRVKLNNEKELVSRRAAAANKREQFRVLEQKLAKSQQQLAATELRAPADGLVVFATSMARGRGGWGNQGSGPLQVGREVTNNELLISLPDTSEMQASVQVHESLAGRVRPGMTATIKVDAVPGVTFTGKVASIGVMAEQTNWRDPNMREYTVKVALDANDEKTSQLKPSMRAEARIEMGRVDDALSVPLQAVFNEGAVRFVYVAEGGRFAKLPVSVGRRSDTLAEIRAGLDEGAVVLLREPTPGEVIERPWDKEQLAKAGYTLDESGTPVAMGRGGPPGVMPTGMPGGMPPGAGNGANGAGGPPPGVTGGGGRPDGARPGGGAGGRPDGARPDGARSGAGRPQGQPTSTSTSTDSEKPATAPGKPTPSGQPGGSEADRKPEPPAQQPAKN
jgi:HlyD family secretion protein